MSGSEDDDDKQHEPTQKKLDDARKKGEIPKSTDLNTAASYSGILFVSVAIGSGALQQFAQMLSVMVENSDRLSEIFFSDSAHTISGGIFQVLFRTVSPWFFIPALLVILVILAQRSFVVAPSKLMPKLSRISPLSNAKNKFGRSGIFEFLKSFVKLIIYSVVLMIFLSKNMPVILGTIHLSAAMISSVLMRLVVEFLALILVISISIGAVDYLWQYKEHMRKNRMSRKEMTDEAKQSEGDPHVKQQRRQKGYEIAMNQMIADVPNADVILVNPEHYAVALQWDRASGAAPVCLAKGVDQIAARIREIAIENGIPIHRDPPTTRAIFASVEVGQEIFPEHYRAVAAAIRFAEAIRKKARKVKLTNA